MLLSIWQKFTFSMQVQILTNSWTSWACARNEMPLWITCQDYSFYIQAGRSEIMPMPIDDALMSLWMSFISFCHRFNFVLFSASYDSSSVRWYILVSHYPSCSIIGQLRLLIHNQGWHAVLYFRSVLVIMCCLSILCRPIYIIFTDYVRMNVCVQDVVWVQKGPYNFAKATNIVVELGDEHIFKLKIQKGTWSYLLSIGDRESHLFSSFFTRRHKFGPKGLSALTRDWVKVFLVELVSS